MATHSREQLQRVERELERIGLLLEHDQALPSVTGLVAGEPIRGSWWGHPLGHVIYELIGELSERSGALDAKLVNGKVTYVHPRLWPAFFALASDVDPLQLRALPPLAQKLWARVQEHGPQRLDTLQHEGLGSGKELTAAARELERKILVHSESIHTDSGAHARQLQTWAAWRAKRSEKIAQSTLASARDELAAALATLSKGCARPAKLAWLGVHRS